mgnify:CR=1 FL=1
MKLFSIDRIIHLPSIKRNKINLSANVSKEFDEVKTNRINRLSFPHKINNILNKRKTNEIKIFTPIKSRLTNVLNNLDNFNSFNSLDLSKTKDRNKYNYFYNSNNIRQNIENPLINYKLINSRKTKRRINVLNLKEKNEISKRSYYNNKEKNSNKFSKEKNNRKLSKKNMINMLKKINNLESKNYCFLSYAYNEYDNIPNRKSMEDFHCIKKNLLNNNNNGLVISYFAIFDGHGGKEVSLFLSQHFHNVLFYQLKNINNFEDSEDNLIKIISLINNSFLLIDKKILNDPSLKDDVGSTATIVFLFKLGYEEFFSKYLICANIGDSKGYILSPKKMFQITKDHNCFNENEVARVKKNGGVVFNNRVYGTLMLTRSLGDKEMKKHGVICEPDFFWKKIDDDDKFIIIASDGLWDTLNENDVIEYGEKYGNKLSSEEFSKKIVKLAVRKGTKDNVSCIVIKLNK